MISSQSEMTTTLAAGKTFVKGVLDSFIVMHQTITVKIHSSVLFRVSITNPTL